MSDSNDDASVQKAIGETHSPFQDFFGYTAVEARRGYAVMEIPCRPEFENRTGRLHGGVIMVLIDTVGGYCGCAEDDGTLPRRAVTLSVTTSFIGRADGDRLRAVGKVTGGGRSIFFTSVTIYDTDGSVVATGEGTYKYMRTPEST